jgi:hypothetical protein
MPLQIKLLAEAAYLAASADEPLEMNFVRAHALAAAGHAAINAAGAEALRPVPASPPAAAPAPPPTWPRAPAGGSAVPLGQGQARFKGLADAAGHADSSASTIPTVSGSGTGGLGAGFGSGVAAATAAVTPEWPVQRGVAPSRVPGPLAEGGATAASGPASVRRRRRRTVAHATSTTSSTPRSPS